MVLAMSRPIKDKKTGVYYFRKAVPKDLRDILGWEEKWSLGTKDPVEARTAHAEKAAEIAAKWKALRSEAVDLSHKEIIALAGVAYRELIDLLGDEPGEDSIWHEVLRLHAEAQDEGLLEQWFGPTVDELLLRQGLKVKPDARERLLKEVSKGIVQASQQKAREAAGDYRKDPAASRFPEWTGKKTDDVMPSSETSFSKLVEGWWSEASAAGRTLSTYESYRNTLRKFSDFLGHEDAPRVTPEDVIAYKDHRLREINLRTGKPVSPKTIKDSDLAGLKSVFGWAVSNRRMTTNPAKDVTVTVGKRVHLRPKGFTDAEATTLLRAASSLDRGREQEHTFNAKRWVPWLCAYTGARVGEMVQLRKEDLSKEDGLWSIRITPEAFTVKNKKARSIVLHSHLVDLGFPEFVRSSKSGYLFLSPAEGDDYRGRWRSAKNRLREFVRSVITDPAVQPNHAWRHRFKTVGVEVGMTARTLDYIQGHAPRSEGETYGDVTLKAQARELAKMPRYEE